MYKFNYNNCPICDKELVYWDRKKECKSGCYQQHKNFSIIFGEVVIREQELKEWVEYWRENDRYLLKFMGVE